MYQSFRRSPTTLNLSSLILHEKNYYRYSWLFVFMSSLNLEVQRLGFRDIAYRFKVCGKINRKQQVNTTV